MNISLAVQLEEGEEDRPQVDDERGRRVAPGHKHPVQRQDALLDSGLVGDDGPGGEGGGGVGGREEGAHQRFQEVLPDRFVRRSLSNNSIET